MGPGTLLPWTYYILGPDNAQLGVWHGLQGSVNCDPTAPTDPTSVRMWPVEYNSYSVGGRVILRPDGRKELVVTNHLGSTVAVVEVSTPTAPVVGQQHTTAYGQPITVKGAVDADRARTGYIGRETDAEHNLGAYGARLYSSAYGRFLAVDKLWEKYRSLQPYQYAANSPVMFLDYSGKHIVGLRERDRDYVRSAMQEQFGVEVSFNSNDALTISEAQLLIASERLSAESFGQLHAIVQLATSEKIVNVVAIEGTNERVDGFTLTGLDATGNPGSVSRNVFTGPGHSEFFLSSADRPDNSFVVIRPDLVRTETFKAVGGGQTSPCGSCVLVHALLDHALPWMKHGVSSTRKEGVEGHNTALKNCGSERMRDGTDHTEQGDAR
jgi:RHS repeat-associated protein